MDRIFKAMADPTRLAVLRALRGGPVTAGKLAQKAGAAPNALSFHLRVLAGAGLVSDRREGRFIMFMLNTEAIAIAADFLEGLRAVPVRPVRRVAVEAADVEGEQTRGAPPPPSASIPEDDVTLL